jgi:hypothetical protein
MRERNINTQTPGSQPAREVLDLARRLDTMLSSIEDHEQKKELK